MLSVPRPSLDLNKRVPSVPSFPLHPLSTCSQTEFVYLSWSWSYILYWIPFIVGRVEWRLVRGLKVTPVPLSDVETYHWKRTTHVNDSRSCSKAHNCVYREEETQGGSVEKLVTSLFYLFILTTIQRIFHTTSRTDTTEKVENSLLCVRPVEINKTTSRKVQ